MSARERLLLRSIDYADAWQANPKIRRGLQQENLVKPTNDMMKNDPIGDWAITTTRLAEPVQMGPVTSRYQTVTKQDGKIRRMSGAETEADAMAKHAEHVALVKAGDIS